jgi:hypothetical protein
LTDAYAGKVVSAEQLSAALRACAGHSAQGIVQGIESAVLPGEGPVAPRDDIVLLVLRLPTHDRQQPQAWLPGSPDRSGTPEPA